MKWRIAKSAGQESAHCIRLTAVEWYSDCSWQGGGTAMAQKLLYAFYRHPDGSWYRIWMTHSEPKTPRGHEWHVHASFDKSGATAPVAGFKWYDQPYGMANWDFDSFAEAVKEFDRHGEDRLGHGYDLLESGGRVVHSAAVTKGAS
jgi:hypothetical protein